MKSSRIRALLAVIAILLANIAIPASAAQVNGYKDLAYDIFANGGRGTIADLQDMKNKVGDVNLSLDALLAAFKEKAKKIGGNIYPYARGLFWALAAIEFMWACFNLGIGGRMDFGSAVQVLIKEVMLIGIFLFALENWDKISNEWIPHAIGFILPERALDIADYTPIGIMGQGVAMAEGITRIADKLGSWQTYIVSFIPAGIALWSFASASGAALLYEIEFYVLMPCGIILLGFGGSTWTKNYVNGYIRALVNVGMKLLTVKVIISVVMGFTNNIMSSLDWLTPIIGIMNGAAMTVMGGQKIVDELIGSMGIPSPWAVIFGLSGLSVVLYVLISKVPEFVTTMLSGSTINTGMSTLSGAATGMARSATSPFSKVGRMASAQNIAARSAAGAGAAAMAMGEITQAAASAPISSGGGDGASSQGGSGDKSPVGSETAAQQIPSALRKERESGSSGWLGRIFGDVGGAAPAPAFSFAQGGGSQGQSMGMMSTNKSRSWGGVPAIGPLKTNDGDPSWVKAMKSVATATGVPHNDGLDIGLGDLAFA